MKQPTYIARSTEQSARAGMKTLGLTVIILGLISGSIASAQEAIAPPSLGQETKGKPAIAEDQSLPESTDSTEQTDPLPNSLEEGQKTNEKGKQKGINNVLGHATIKESKRESGQRYLIELEHSAGTKQYIEETDSDGKIESTSNDIEETPNLPKWKIGSW